MYEISKCQIADAFAVHFGIEMRQTLGIRFEFLCVLCWVVMCNISEIRDVIMLHNGPVWSWCAFKCERLGVLSMRLALARCAFRHGSPSKIDSICKSKADHHSDRIVRHIIHFVLRRDMSNADYGFITAAGVQKSDDDDDWDSEWENNVYSHLAFTPRSTSTHNECVVILLFDICPTHHLCDDDWDDISRRWCASRIL